MEEARHPRQPISYDHFPVEPGEAPDHNQAENPLGPPFNPVMSVASTNRPLTLLPSGEAAQPSGPHSFNPEQTLHTEAPEYEETGVAPPPFTVYMHAHAAEPPCPPGLESHHSSSLGGSHTTESSRHHVPLSPPPSRPPTASAPPAYTPSPSDSVLTQSAIALPVSQNVTPAGPQTHSPPPLPSSHAVPALS